LPRLAEDVRARFSELNVLVANAGISRAENMAADGWDVSAAQAIVETNIMGVLRVTAELLPLLKRQPDAAIMATSSNLAFVPRADFPTYCASKAFVHSWLQSLRHQLRNVPVEVLELAPPYVQTELTGDSQASDPRAMPLAAYVAEVMQLLLNSARSPETTPLPLAPTPPRARARCSDAPSLPARPIGRLHAGTRAAIATAPACFPDDPRGPVRSR
jgi:short-subunit dehydrogenase involved in D-alanine esterification of teichoic acids